MSLRQYSWQCHGLEYKCTLSNPRTNQYDDEELEYWVDYRTEGSRGTEERDGIEDTMEGATDGFASNALDDGPVPTIPMQSGQGAGLTKEDAGQAS